MKKNVLALSIAAMIGGLGFAGAASADVIRGTGANWNPGTGTNGVMTTSTDNAVLEIADAGTGHMLLMPYFNAQNNNMTVLHVVNTDTSNGKAVKVRFRSAANSDDILDFQVFMSPADVWTAAVSAGPDGIAQITTADGTCTVPKLAKGVAQPFVTDRLNPGIAADSKANQTREGYVEIFNMADIPSNAVYQNVGANAPAPSPLYTAIKHVNGVAPCATAGSAAETTLFNVATTNFIEEGRAAFAGLNTPTGGLLGDWYIINTAQTTTFSGGATSISAKTAFGASGASARGSFVHFPQIDTAVDAASMLRYSADPLFRTDAYYNSTVANNNATPQVTVGRNTVAGQNLAGAFYDLPDMSTPYVTAAANATAPKIQAAVLTRALAVTSLTNQYATDASISAKTDWVFSMPTRRYNVAANYSAVANGATAQNAPTYRLFTDLEQAGTLPGNPGTVPATPNWFVPANTSVDVLGNICVNSDGQRLWDREETTAGTTGTAPVFSPRTPGVPSVVRFCGEVSVLQFKDEGASVLGASVARTTLTNPGFDNGWGLISTNNVVANNAGTSSTAVGLPILGFGVQRLTNPNVGNGVSGNFGITWPHRNTRLIAQ